MSIYFNITSPDNAYAFLLEALGMQPEDLIMEYSVECDKDVDLFWGRNGHRLDKLDIQDVHFVAFHVTGSLDNCQEIKESGIRDLQYVLSHNTMLARMLDRGDITFDIANRIMYVSGKGFDIDYEHYRGRSFLTPEEECLDSIAHRIYYDFCVDGFWANDDIEGYGTDIHERPEFISKLVKMSPKAKLLDTFWRSKSKPYKIFFYATIDQIHKFTFGLEKNYDPYTEEEQESIKKWMLRMALDQAFDPGGEHYIYIRDCKYIPSEQIIRCERMS